MGKKFVKLESSSIGNTKVVRNSVLNQCPVQEDLQQMGIANWNGEQKKMENNFSLNQGPDDSTIQKVIL